MSFKKFAILACAIAVAASLAGIRPISIQAAPLAQNNLLNNPGMDLPFSNGKQPDGWGRWFEDTGKPTDASGLDYAIQPNFSAETGTPALIHGGSASAHIGRQYDPWHAGLKQDVTVPPNTPLQFCAYNQLFAGNSNYGKGWSVYSMNGRGMVGIYPDGFVEWNNSGIVWSGQINPHEWWQQVCVQVTSGPSGKVSVFTSNDYRGSGAIHLDAWWDDASLVATGQPQAQPTTAAQPVAVAQPAAPQQQPQPTPVPQVIETPNAQGAVVHTVVAGDTLFAMSLQYNVPLDQIYALNNLNSQSILSIGQQIIIKSGSGAPPAQPTAAPPAAEVPTQEAAPGATPNAAAPAGATPEAAQPTAAAAAATNQLCVFAFNDANSDGLLQTGEGPVAGAKFNVIDAQGNSAETYTSTDDPAPHCFTDLPAGSYTVDVQPAPNTTATSDKRWGVALTSGSTVNINFGSEGGGTGSAAPDATPAKSSSSSSIGGLLGGAIGLILLLVAGVMGAFIIARRRG